MVQHKFPLGLRGRLLALVLVLLLPVLALGGVDVYSQYQARVDDELAESQALAEAVSTALVNFLEHLWNVELATGLGIAIDNEFHTVAEVEAYLDRQLRDSPTINAFTWVGPDGRVIASTSERMRSISVADRAYFQRLLQGEERVVSDVLTSRATGQPSIVVARRIDLDGRFSGVMAAGVDLGKLRQVLPDLATRGRRFGFVDRTGMTIYDSERPNPTLAEPLLHPSDAAARALQGETVLTPSFRDPASGERRMGVAVPIPGLGWAYTSSVSHGLAVADIWKATWRELIVLLAVAALSTLVASYLSRSILRPVLALQKAARAISGGDLGARVDSLGLDEVAAAARAFNSMASRVQSADELLKSRVTAVARLSQQALSGVTTAELADAAAGVVAISLGVEAASVLALYPNTEKVHVWSAVGLSDYLVGRTVATGYAYLAETVLSRNEPVVLDDLPALLGSEQAELGGTAIRTAAAVKIQGDDAPFGALIVASTRERQFSQPDLHFLQAVANVVATATQRNRTEFEQAFLARAGSVLARSLSIDEIMAGVAELITEQQADWCFVDLTLAGNQRRVVRTSRADQAELARAMEQGRADSSPAAMAAMAWAYSGQAYIRRRVTEESMADLAGDDKALLGMLRALQAVSAILVPLVARDEVIGMIAMTTSDQAGYDSRDLDLAEELARRAALAIGHGAIYADLRLLARQQAAIAELGQTLIAGAGLSTILTEGVALVERELEVPQCRILELQPDGRGLRVRTGPEWRGGLTLPLELPGQGLTPLGAALEQQRPVTVTDIRRETRFAIPPEMQQVGVVSGAWVVIPGNEEPYGLLAVYAREPRPFTEDEVHFLMGIATLFSHAVQHERDEQRLHTQHAVARLLAEGGPDAISQILRTLGEGLGWDIVFFWMMDLPTETATITELWQAPGLEAAPFIEACRGFVARRREGVIGEVWETARPRWIPDLAQEGAFLRGKSAALAGFHGVLLIPVLVGDEVRAVIECFSREVRRPDRAVIAMATTTGHQIGQLLQRHRAESDMLQLNAVLEERVVARTAELAAANRELESFAYSVSHDLRAPLRTIDGFSQMLGEDYGDKVGEDGRDEIRRIRAAAKKMGALIDDMLRLSRVVRHELRRGRVNLTALARSVVADLEREQPRQPPVSVRVDEGMSAVGDERLLYLLLQNLVGNAWKFTGRSPAPMIHIGVERQHGQPVYFVRDNGVGFDMAYADRLFDPFQRLHPAREFEGTGIGLATVQRVIQRHGGRVWAEGRVGEGAVFFFTLDEGRRS